MSTKQVLILIQVRYPILILVSYHYKMSKKGVLGFSIYYLVLEIFRFLTCNNFQQYIFNNFQQF